MICYRRLSGPPKIAPPPGLSVVIFLVIDGPPNQVCMAAMDGLPGPSMAPYRWSPLATDGPLLENHSESFMMASMPACQALCCKVQPVSCIIMFQFAGFDHCTHAPEVADSS